MTKRTLVVWYSREGTTSTVATLIAKSLGADLDAIEEAASRRGAGGYFRSAIEAVAKGLPAIRTQRDPRDYDLVVVGTPVWVGTLSSPVRSYLYAHRGHLGNAAFFAVMGGRGAEETLREMRFASGVDLAPTRAFTRAEVEAGRHGAKCERFARQLEALLDRGGPLQGEVPGVPVDFHPGPVTIT